MRIPKCCLVKLASLVLLAGMLWGCSAAPGQNRIYGIGGDDAPPETKLTFFGFKYEALNVTAIEDALHQYMNTYPEVSISYDGIKSPQYFDVLEKRLSTGNGDDIFMVDHERVIELANRGMLADLSGLSTLEDFSSLAKSQMSAGIEGIYYVPTSISAFGLYCNRDLLKKHKQDIPENLPEFEAVCDYFVANGITPIVANNDISLKTVAIAKAMLPVYQSGNSVEELERFNRGEADLAEALRPGFELVERMLQRRWVDTAETLATEKTKDDLLRFAEGRHPFMLTGAWAVPRLRELHPDFQFEVRPYPIFEDGSALVINVDTRISVNAASPNVREAIRFVEYLTQKDVMWEFVDSQSSFSPLLDNRLAKDQAVQSIAPYLTNGRSVLGADDNLQLPIWDVTRQSIFEMLNGGSVQAAVDHMKAQIAEWEQAEKEG